MTKLQSLFPQELRPAKPAPGADKPDAAQGKGKLKGPAHTFVREFVPGQEVEGVYLVQEATFRAAKNASKYVQSSLGDRTGYIATRHWDATDQDFAAYQLGKYIKLRGRVETYQNRPQLIVFGAQPVDAATVDPTDYLPVSTRSTEDLARELDGVLAGIKDPDYRRLLDAMLGAGPLREAFLKGPAASSVHHAWVGGLAEHVLSACRTADVVAQQRPFLNRELLMTGVLLHDIGKTEEIDAGPGFTYTDAGKLCGHIPLGALMVERQVVKLEGFPPTKRNLILHMILSHHGEREMGSPVTPCTAEAVALHHIECLDAKVQGIQTIVEREREAGQTSSWTDFARVVDGRIYKGEKNGN